MPARHDWQGTLHPVTLVIDEICEIFRDLGFTRVRGGEVETVEYNFVKLNIPAGHPAREPGDNFYVDNPAKVTAPRMLRSQTSTVQVRAC